MVVRFVPTGQGTSAEGGSERANLAEVIEFRTRLADKLGADAVKASDESLPTPVAPLIQLSSRGAVTGVRATQSDEFVSDADNADEDLDEVPAEPIADAVRLLARRARSSGELRRELVALGHSATDIEDVIQECETSLYLDDLGLARVLTESLRERKRASRVQIQRKLRERVLPDWVIEEVLAELDDEVEHELLREAAHDRARKMRGLDRHVAERRLLGFLARRGWTGERATRVAREALDTSAARGTVTFR